MKMECQQQVIQVLPQLAIQSSGHNQHGGQYHQMNHQQQQQQHQPTIMHNNHYQQQSANQSPLYTQIVTTPPTPPNECDTIYLSPTCNSNMQTTTTASPAWTVVQSQHQPQQQQQQQQQHFRHQQNQNQHHHNQQQQQHHSHQNQQQHNHVYHSNQAGQQTAIENYYFDINDEFSDILSAPPTPEPLVHDHHHHQSSNAYNVSDSGNNNNNNCHNNDQYTTTIDRYQNYLPFNTNHPVLNQPSEQCHHQAYIDLNSHYVMSPDSSSLSTTSSSPSDHSLYQSQSSVACNVLTNQQLNQIGGRTQQQQQQQQQHQQQHHSIQQECAKLSQDLTQHQPICSPLLQTVTQQQQQQTTPNHLSRNGDSVSKQQTNQAQQQITTTIQAQTNITNRQQNPNHHHHHHRSSPIHLWEFLKELLQQVESGCADATVIRWLDKQRGVFKIEDSVRVAKLWGKRKNKPKMNYDKLSRSIRQYYKKGIMKKTDRSQRLVYQFCSAYCH